MGFKLLSQTDHTCRTTNLAVLIICLPGGGKSNAEKKLTVLGENALHKMKDLIDKKKIKVSEKIKAYFTRGQVYFRVGSREGGEKFLLTKIPHGLPQILMNADASDYIDNFYGGSSMFPFLFLLTYVCSKHVDVE